MISRIINSSLFSMLMLISCSRAKEANRNYQDNMGSLHVFIYDHRDVLLEENVFALKDSDTILHGLQTGFYSDGQVKFVVEYQMGEKTGKHIEYFENGELKFSGTFLNGVQFGDALHFRNDGSIETYFYLNSSGEIIYKREYDENGNFVTESGNPIFIVQNKDKFKRGDTLIIELDCGIPPECSFQKWHVTINLNGSVVDSIDSTLYSKNEVMVIPLKYHIEGNFELSASMISNQNESEKLYSIRNNFEVVE